MVFKKGNIIKIPAPASKSYMQRALAAALLAKGETVLKNVSWCNDSLVAKKIIEDLGADTVQKNHDLFITSGFLKPKTKVFSAGEAGLSVRMFSPVLALFDDEIEFTGEGSLLNRPVEIIEDALKKLGVKVESNNGFLPLKIKGPLKPGKITVDGSLSSQLLTGLLITLPLLDGDSEIKVENLKSIPYIDMTIEVMENFGINIVNKEYKLFKIKGNQKYKSTVYNIEGDWSGAAFWLVLGAVKGNIEVLNLDYSSRQADKQIIKALTSAGADVKIKPGSVYVNKNKLNAFEFDATHCPDLFPPLACLAAACNGTSVIKGVSRLKHKESDRATVLKKEFAKVGINISLDGDFMKITGGKIKIGTIDSNNDHRIAMAGGILNLIFDEPVNVINKKAVNKSYPEFFEILNSFEK